MTNTMGSAFYIAWKGLGIVFDDVIETYDYLIIYISVPSSSEHKDVHGNEMAGKHLAHRFKDTLVEMGIKNLTVKCKVRDEFWTKEKDKFATEAAKKELFRSQA